MMRAVLAVLLASGLALVVAGASIRAGDRDVLIPPPEAVAEGFVRSVVEGRYEPARRYLTDRAGAAAGIPELTTLQHLLDATGGASRRVDAQANRHNGSEATATAIVRGRSQATVLMHLQFKNTAWKVDGWSVEAGPAAFDHTDQHNR